MSARPDSGVTTQSTPEDGAAAEAVCNVEVTDDAFLGGALRILQPATGYRAGLDAVLLAASVSGKGTAGSCRVLDAGSGVGVVGLCIAGRLPCCEAVLVERRADLAALAERNISRNNFVDRVRAVRLDVRSPEREHRTAGIKSGSFDVVVANPPYLSTGTGRASADPIKREANVMAADDLELWARFLARMAAPSGRLAMIHRADALSRLLAALEGRFGGLELLPIHPRAGAPANRILVHGRKGSRAPLVVHAGLVLHGDDGRFTPELEGILRAGAGLTWPVVRPAGDD